MSNQYFNNNPNLESKPIFFEYYCLRNIIKFKSDNGVFSKNGIDFGTNLLIKSIKFEDTKTVLDCGCGIGIIGLTVAKINPDIQVDMIDVNKRAINLAKENALLNKIDNVNIFESNVYENVTKEYDMIISNPPIRAGKQVVHTILREGKNHLVNGGCMYIVIQKKQGAESALKLLRETYKTVEIITKDKGYYIIKSIK